LIDLNGRVLLRETVDTDNCTVNINHIQNGLYLYRLIKGEQVMCVGKIVKQI